MNVYWHLVIIVFSIASRTIQQELWEIIDLRAISYFYNIEEYYLSVKAQKLGVVPVETEDSEKRAKIKKKICQNIFSSNHIYLKSWIDVDDRRIRAELKNDYPDIFATLFKERDQRSWYSFWNDKYEYVNAYEERLYSPSLDGDIAYEYMFVCPVRDWFSEEIEYYFVTQEYNVNLFQIDEKPIAGRFVMHFDDEFGFLIEAMAEESAIGSEFARRSHITDVKYVNARLFDYTNGSRRLDPICHLTHANKVRLCASLFGASVFVNKMIHSSKTIDDIEDECEKKRVIVAAFGFIPSITMGLISADYFRNVGFEEWVIGCKALITNTYVERTYYVSRGDTRNSIYVYTNANSDDDGEVLLYNYFRNVSVAGVVGDIDEESESDYRSSTEENDDFDYGKNDSDDTSRILSITSSDFDEGLSFNSGSIERILPDSGEEQSPIQSDDDEDTVGAIEDLLLEDFTLPDTDEEHFGAPSDNDDDDNDDDHDDDHQDDDDDDSIGIGDNLLPDDFELDEVDRGVSFLYNDVED